MRNLSVLGFKLIEDASYHSIHGHFCGFHLSFELFDRSEQMLIAAKVLFTCQSVIFPIGILDCVYLSIGLNYFLVFLG